MKLRGYTRRQFLRMSAAAGAAVPALLAACSPKTSSSRRPIRVGWSSEPDTMNPLTTYSTEADEVLQLLYDKLMEYDVALKPTPSLATSSTYSSDGTSITYRLRSGVRWHDGQPFTADDVKFT